jgi:hypothetical protein
MGFPNKVAEDALIACGRHCSLCHKFCGTKIELHHIKQSADGGEDTFENCIPLCFECHAEVKAYNPRHPKWRKFSESELTRHRNKWYMKVEGTSGIVVDDDYIDLDREVYTKIKEIFSRDEVLIFVEEQNFYGWSFPLSKLQPLDDFIYESKSPEFEFIDSDLEGYLSNLKSAVLKYRKLISTNTFPVSSGYNSVPPEWELEQPERFEKVVSEIHYTADEIIKSYTEIVKQGRRKLKI